MRAKGGPDWATRGIPAFPGLWPQMLLPLAREAAPFPFDRAGVRYFNLARNAIYSLALHWKLGGQEVLFPTYCHGVELETLRAAGVRLRFYPLRDRMRVAVDDVVARIGPDTRAIYLIHYLGFPGPVEELSEICRERNLLMIEDCALALLSHLGDRPLGSFGDAAVFCLYKTLPLPNGGALVLRQPDVWALPETTPPALVPTLAHAAYSLDCHFRLQGNRWGRLFLRAVRGVGKAISDAGGDQPAAIGPARFDRPQASLAMSRLSHSVLRAQDFSQIVERRRRNYLHLLGRLGHLVQPLFADLRPGICPLFFPCLVADKPQMMERLAARGLGEVNWWGPEHPAVPGGAFPEVDELRRTLITFPCHQDLTREAMDWIADQVCEVVREVA